VCESAAHELVQANFMVFEANYDLQMLLSGRYPADLKRRVNSDNGHLSNDQAGEFLARNYAGHLKYVFLCHLSKENNRPELAYSTVKSHLEKNRVKVGSDLKLITLDRFSPTELYIFD
jgi:phosphoribosyl 1,2-cyclic phosphodiesterase